MHRNWAAPEKPEEDRLAKLEVVRGGHGADPEGAGARPHIPALDGVRGLAILMVLFGHFWLASRPSESVERALYTIVQNGWIGVDLFFVLSGFLITGILLDAKGSDGYFRNFYARRALRIFPLYYAVLFAWFYLLPDVFGVDRAGPFGAEKGTQIWFWTYTSNFISVMKNLTMPHGLNHFWTLAIEEQFYLVWPLVVLAVSSRKLRWICLALLPVGLLFRLWLMTTEYAHTGGYVLTPARMGTLAVGAWLASAIREPGLKKRVDDLAPLFLAGTALILLAINLPDFKMEGHEPAMQTIGFPMLAIFSAALLVVVMNPKRMGSWYQRTFRSRPLRFFGKYSYGMYVLHLPVVIAFEGIGFGIDSFVKFGRSDMPGTLIFTATATAATTLLAFISWHVYEKQFLKLKKYFPVAAKAVEKQHRNPLMRGDRSTAREVREGVARN